MTLNAHANQQSTANVFSFRRQRARRELMAVRRLRPAFLHLGHSPADAISGLQSEEDRLDSSVCLCGDWRDVERRALAGSTAAVLTAEAGLLADSGPGEERFVAALDDEDEDENDDLDDDDLDEDDEEDFEDEDDDEDFQDEDEEEDFEDDEDDLDEEVDEEE